MLIVNVTADELFDESKNEFLQVPAIVLELEHSLVSLSKWESKWKKPYLAEESKTDEQAFDYVECMILTPNFPRGIARAMSQDQMDEIAAYIEDDMTATWFAEPSAPPRHRKTLTNELIYYWMTAFGIWKECEEWHLNRLLTLIQVANVQSKPPEKKSQAQISAEQSALAAKRREEMGTSG